MIFFSALRYAAAIFTEGEGHEAVEPLVTLHNNIPLPQVISSFCRGEKKPYHANVTLVTTTYLNNVTMVTITYLANANVTMAIVTITYLANISFTMVTITYLANVTNVTTVYPADGRVFLENS